ncbi:undecaprenyl-phosphate galactose phosphotransferase WbaP [Serratia fonticola]|uniref:undecaprenyl-phosphate galactose phosphotransferase WbaP n=1 Tax=Serratia fonticola TaxID=47917 RepID=UPI001C48AF70|nr:undecaprenyl-phosphate galactose phosphotransferase WbaP [Serratia fonticola]QXN62367.1 undecaprenyl-phosphate galactose phosphotransferase WbaP [Serratia fonticola]
MDITLKSKRYKLLICKLAMVVSDLFFINISLLLSMIFIECFIGNLSDFIPKDQLEIRIISHAFLSILCVAWFLVRLRHYTYRKPFWFELKEIIRTLLIFSVIDLALVAFSKWQFSRYLWLFCWTFSIFLVPFGRFFSRKLLDKLGIWSKKTIILGTGKNAVEAMSALHSEEMLGFDIIAFCDVGSGVISVSGLPVINNEKDFWLNVHPDETHIIVAFEFEESDKVSYWLKSLSKNKCRSVTVVPSLRGVPLYGTDMSFIFSHEVILLRVNNNLAKRTSRIIKRSFDIIGALSITILLSPVLIILALLVKKDGGASIYGHERIGLNGERFNCYKFRSMVLNSREVLEDLLANSEEARNEWNKDFKLKSDPRITKVGYFIRKTSLDELPQLFNVIKGEMSLVGPRPIIEAELERYAGDVDYYLMAKPGMTGLWQVSGRNNVDYDTRVYFDAWYVKNWSLWNDIVILFKTVSVVIRRDGAY